MTATLTRAQVTDAQLAKYADLIYSHTGIRISPQKKNLLSNRLQRRMKVLELDCYDQYYAKLRTLPRESEEWTAFLQEITTHESYLFRDGHHWDWLRTTFLQDIAAEARAGKRARTLRIWSAACSTGDEPYTIACCIADSLMDHANWKVDIVGTDIGQGAIAAAIAGNFAERAMQGVPDSYKRRFFTPVKKADPRDLSIWTAKPNIRNWVRFRRHNLLHPLNEQPFDLVIIKNVLIYFDDESKKKVMKHALAQLKPGGSLVTGPAEGVSGLLRDLTRVQGWLHRK